jgi:hypothetical protein
MKHLWHLWALAIGEKAHKKDGVADRVAIIRTLIFISYLTTNMFIVAGVIRHWNDEPAQIIIEGVPEQHGRTEPADKRFSEQLY